MNAGEPDSRCNRRFTIAEYTIAMLILAWLLGSVALSLFAARMFRVGAYGEVDREAEKMGPKPSRLHASAPDPVRS